MALRPCANPTCGNLVTRGYCGNHSQQLKSHPRESSTKRGYDKAWRKFRAWFLAQPANVLCHDCKTAKPTDVHHVRKISDAPQLRLAAGNCMALCSRCHDIRTARGE